MDSSTIASLKSRNSINSGSYREKNKLDQYNPHKNKSNTKTIDIKKFHSQEKKIFNETLLRKKQKYLTNLNTTRENTLTSESSKKETYYEKFITRRKSDFSAEIMNSQLNKENIEDNEFINYILFNILNNENTDNKSEANYISLNYSMNNGNDITNEFIINYMRKYIIKIEKNFKREIKEKLNQSTHNQNFVMSCYFLNKLENLISRFGIVIFFLFQIKKIELAKKMFLLMLKENYTYIDYIENNIIEWYSILKRRINMSKEYPKVTYKLIKIYSFIIKYSQHFNMMNYCNIFIRRYFDIVFFIYNFFLCKSNFRGFNLDTRNQLNFWLSLAIHNVSYFSISNYFPLNVSINLNNHIANIYKNSDENNLTDDEKSLIVKTLYNLSLFYYLNGQNDLSLSNLKDAKELILNIDEDNIYQIKDMKPASNIKESIFFNNKNNNNNINKEQLRHSTGTTFSENNNNDNLDSKISLDKMKEIFLKGKIKIEDIKLIINYGIKEGIINKNNSVRFNNLMTISPNNNSPKCELKCLSVPKCFKNPLLRKIELFQAEIELDKKNYNSSYDHVLKALYILISLKINKNGNEFVVFNSEKKIIQKYLELISKLKDKEVRQNKKDKSEINLPLINQSLIDNNNINNDNDLLQENNNIEEASDKMLEKYIINKTINSEENNELKNNKKKKKKEILICGIKGQDTKLLKEIEKFFIFLNTLTLYQIKMLNETQPDNIKSKDLPILFSSQFKDCLSHRQRIELDNLQTMALTRFIILKDSNKWIMPTNLNIGIIEEQKVKNDLRRKTMKFLNKYCISNKTVNIKKTREFKYFQEIIKSKKVDNKLKDFINKNFNYVIKVLKKLNEEEIKDIINSPKIIIQPVKSYKKKLRNQTKKNNSKNKKEDSFILNNSNRYDYDEDNNFFNNRYSTKGGLRTYSAKLKIFQNNLNSLKKIDENVIRTFYPEKLSKNDKRNNSVQFKKNKHKNSENEDYNDNYQDFQISIGETSLESEE